MKQDKDISLYSVGDSQPETHANICLQKHFNDCRRTSGRADDLVELIRMALVCSFSWLE